MAATEKELAEARVRAARAALDDDFATLQDRLPAMRTIAQAGAAGTTGITLLGIGATQALKKLSERNEAKQLTREAQIQAQAIAAALAASGLVNQGGGGSPQEATPRHETRAARAPAAPLPSTGQADGSDDGPPWGILLLLAALAAAVFALVTSNRDDSDLWSTPDA